MRRGTHLQVRPRPNPARTLAFAEARKQKREEPSAWVRDCITRAPAKQAHLPWQLLSGVLASSPAEQGT